MLMSSENLWVIVEDGNPLGLKRTERKFNIGRSAIIPSELLFEIYSDFDLAVNYVENLKNQPSDNDSGEKTHYVPIIQIVPLSILLSKMMEKEYDEGYNEGKYSGYDSGYHDGRSDEKECSNS